MAATNFSAMEHRASPWMGSESQQMGFHRVGALCEGFWESQHWEDLETDALAFKQFLCLMTHSAPSGVPKAHVRGSHAAFGRSQSHCIPVPSLHL